MEETLKLILEKLSSLDHGQKELVTKVDSLENRFDSLENKVDSLENRFDSLENKMDSLETIQLRMENKMDEKFGALFDAREVSLDTNKRIFNKLDTIQKDLSNIGKVTIKNTADIIALTDYRKEN